MPEQSNDLAGFTPQGETEVSREEKIRSIRIQIDRIIQTNKKVDPSREVSLAFTSLQKGKMWLGKVLGEIGTPNPYKNSSDPTNKIIDPQAEVAEEDYHFQPEWEQVEKVKEMRSIIEIPLSRVELEWTKEINKLVPNRKLSLYLEQSMIALNEARMWYGWELDRIRG